MTFRFKLLLVFTVPVVAAVAVVASAVLATTRSAFERLDEQRTRALVEQFRREFARRGEDVARRVEGVAQTESARTIAIEQSRPAPDYSQNVNEAAALASAHGLDLLELVLDDGTIVSSAQWAARFGYKDEWVTQPVDWKSQGAFLKREELAEDSALALVAVRRVAIEDKNLYVIGGQRLGKEFLSSLVLPAGMRVLLSDNSDPELARLTADVRREHREITRTITWRGHEVPETFQAIPLTGRNDDLLGVLLVGSSRQELFDLLSFIRRTALLVGGLGIVVGIILSSWAAARVTRPVRELAAGARAVAGGNWAARVDLRSRDEIGELGRAFNSMTQQLVDQRERLIQAERVAAWRELARRLAHELKNPLFPLQITIENLQRAKERNPEQFEEVFRESTAALLAELSQLKTIIGHFSDFARMPPPQFEPVHVNEIVRHVFWLFDGQFATASVVPKMELDETIPVIEADPEQLNRALQNLVLNALDAMNHGGSLTARTRRQHNAVMIEVSDTGAGLAKEECERLFTPYYTTKQHGTGLGLAIVQSVVSDHGGRISVESEPGRGTTFHIELPEQHG